MSELVPPDKRLSSALKWSGVAVVLILLIVALGVIVSLQQPQQSDVEEQVIEAPRMTKVETELPTIPFVEVTQSSGIDFEHENGAIGERLLPETMGGGVAIFDFDQDQDEDILFVNSTDWNSSNLDSSKRSELYANDGQGRFSNVTDGVLDLRLYGMAPAIGDINGDSYPDIFVTAVGSNKLLINQQGRGFVDETEKYGVGGDPDAFSSCTTFFDYDLDGDLDLWVCNYVGWSAELDQQVDFRLTGVGRAYGPPTDFPGTNSYLYRNDGNHFENVSQQAGIEVFHPQTKQAIGKALALSVYDVNGDSAPDVFIANDTTRNFLFINQKDGTFVEQGIEYGIAFDSSGSATGAMGIDIANYANDKQLGIAVGNFANEMTSFYVGSESSTLFSDHAITTGIGAQTRKALTFGVFFADFDNDGYLDLLSANGHIEPEISEVQASQQYQQEIQLFWNCATACSRTYQMLDSTLTGLDKPLVGRGAAYGDLDRDGDLDLLVTQTGGKARLYRNDLRSQNKGIRVQLRYKDSNVFGIGSTIVLKQSSMTQKRYITRTRSYLTQVSPSAHFGLGNDAQPYEIEVHWPDQKMENFQLSQEQTHLELRYGESR